MDFRKLTAIATAILLVAGVQAAHAAYSLAQLQEIERLLAAKDYAGLSLYLETYPEITSGPDPLAQELRSFVERVNCDLVECLAAQTYADTRSVDFVTSLIEAY